MVGCAIGGVSGWDIVDVEGGSWFVAEGGVWSDGGSTGSAKSARG